MCFALLSEEIPQGHPDAERGCGTRVSAAEVGGTRLRGSIWRHRAWKIARELFGVRETSSPISALPTLENGRRKFNWRLPSMNSCTAGRYRKLRQRNC